MQKTLERLRQQKMVLLQSGGLWNFRRGKISVNYRKWAKKDCVLRAARASGTLASVFPPYYSGNKYLKLSFHSLTGGIHKGLDAPINSEYDMFHLYNCRCNIKKGGLMPPFLLMLCSCCCFC